MKLRLLFYVLFSKSVVVLTWSDNLWSDFDCNFPLKEEELVTRQRTRSASFLLGESLYGVEATNQFGYNMASHNDVSNLAVSLAQADYYITSQFPKFGFHQVYQQSQGGSSKIIEKDHKRKNNVPRNVAISSFATGFSILSKSLYPFVLIISIVLLLRMKRFSKFF